MPAFRSRYDPGAAGIAGYVRIAPPDAERRCRLGLLMVNAIAEPLELIRLAVRLPSSSLCGGRLGAESAARLIAELLGRSRTRPALLLFDPSDVDADALTERMSFDVPIGFVSDRPDTTAITWPAAGGAPDGSPASSEGNSAAAIVEGLMKLGLLRTPFDRVSSVLRAELEPVERDP